jgi:hypothetical protein
MAKQLIFFITLSMVLIGILVYSSGLSSKTAKNPAVLNQQSKTPVTPKVIKNILTEDFAIPEGVTLAIEPQMSAIILTSNAQKIGISAHQGYFLNKLAMSIGIMFNMATAKKIENSNESSIANKLQIEDYPALRVTISNIVKSKDAFTGDMIIAYKNSIFTKKISGTLSQASAPELKASLLISAKELGLENVFGNEELDMSINAMFVPIVYKL